MCNQLVYMAILSLVLLFAAWNCDDASALAWFMTESASKEGCLHHGMLDTPHACPCPILGLACAQPNVHALHASMGGMHITQHAHLELTLGSTCTLTHMTSVF